MARATIPPGLGKSNPQNAHKSATYRRFQIQDRHDPSRSRCSTHSCPILATSKPKNLCPPTIQMAESKFAGGRKAAGWLDPLPSLPANWLRLPHQLQQRLEGQRPTLVPPEEGCHGAWTHQPGLLRSGPAAHTPRRATLHTVGSAWVKPTRCTDGRRGPLGTTLSSPAWWREKGAGWLARLFPSWVGPRWLKKTPEFPAICNWNK